MTTLSSKPIAGSMRQVLVQTLATPLARTRRALHGAWQALEIVGQLRAAPFLYEAAARQQHDDPALARELRDSAARCSAAGRSPTPTSGELQ